MINIVEWNNFYNKINDFDIVINATSLGLLDGENLNLNYLKLTKNLSILTLFIIPQTKMISNLNLKKSRL